MTINEAATRLGVSPKTLRAQIKNRKLRAHKMGRSWFVAESEVTRYSVENRRPAVTVIELANPVTPDNHLIVSITDKDPA